VGVELIDLGDQLVDALGDVLPPLIRLEELLVEVANSPILLVDFAAQRGVGAQQLLVARHQVGDGALQALEIVVVAVAVRNEVTPVLPDRTEDA